MFKKILAVVFAAVLLAGTACAADIAIVNGRGIPEKALTDAVKAAVAKGEKDTPQLRAQIRKRLIIDEVLYQEAQAKDINRTGAVERRIDRIEIVPRSFAVKALRTGFLRKNPVSEADVRRLYRSYVKTNTGRQYWVKHIIVKTEPEADAVLVRLRKGVRFEDIAAEKNIDDTRGKGGDLGWQHPSSVIKPFADAMVTMKIGGTSDVPVKSPVGYHIIRLVKIRRVNADTYDKVKDILKRNLEDRKWNNYVSRLVRKAQIRY